MPQHNKDAVNGTCVGGVSVYHICAHAHVYVCNGYMRLCMFANMDVIYNIYLEAGYVVQCQSTCLACM